MFSTNVLLICFAFGLNFVAADNLTDVEVLAFDAPNEIKEAFPYYLSGYDDEEAPIWVCEYGKMDFRKYVELGGELFEAMDIHLHQMYLTFRESGLNSSAKQFVFIADVDGFNIRQAGHTKTVQFFIEQFVRVETLFREGSIKQAYIVNPNAVINGIWELGSPLLGSIQNSFEIYGTNKNVWIPKLLKHLPKDQLSEKYGGSADHRPVKTFGFMYSSI